ncbi:hypothetical protein SEA_KNOCKER_19 [Mycobacterium phage Knocker]|nr:hypothetical protein SEA_KNOCKER_19 [Mycobacterium phage Knocker]
MPEGIIATDNGDGFTVLDFVDKSLRGPALAELVEIGGPASIETISRVGPRRMYRVPTGNAEEAGLLDEDTGVRVKSAGYDTGRAAALKAADPNVNAGPDNANWHTPVDQHTSANAYVGQVPNEDVLDRPQVYTGDAGSRGGHAVAPTHRELIDYVRENTAPPTEVEPQQLMAVSTLNTMLKSQPAALGDDPGARPDAGGEIIADDYTTVQQSRDGETVKSADELAGAGVVPYLADAETPTEGPTPEDDPTTGDPGSQPSEEPTTLEPTPPDTEDVIEYPQGTPSMDWTRPELDAYALKVKGLDTSGLPNKTEVLNAINSSGA